jgi:hypothetical protein
MAAGLGPVKKAGRPKNGRQGGDFLRRTACVTPDNADTQQCRNNNEARSARLNVLPLYGKDLVSISESAAS